MTGHFPLDWAILAVSLFNTILLLWLGLTVFLNAERRVWGIWLAAGGLLLGALFFISHSAILGHGLSPATPGLNFWWQIGWVPVAALPLAWYVVMLWYSGFWERREGIKPAESRLHQRHKAWFPLTLLAGLVLIGLLLFFNPLPSFTQLASFDLAAGPSVGGLPVLILAYPLYTLFCTGLSLDVLRRPEPSGRFMGDLARSRARRWLMAASLILFTVSLLVGWVMVWIVRSVQQGLLSSDIVEMIGWFDLVIATLIAGAVLLLGQAVVNYEVFTGKNLPRRGLSQYWRSAGILAAGYSLSLAWSLTLQLRPIYSLLISMLLMVVFFALLGWRAYADRERFIQSLRPFVAQRGLYEDILEGENHPSNSEVEETHQPFHALCTEILETAQACLIPLGSLAPLSGDSLVYPKGARFSLPHLSDMISGLGTPNEIGAPLSPQNHAGMVFAVSLWGERGLIGVLLIGEKQSGGLYTQEEIEIARAVGEHLVDTRASVEMARRLIGLQRQRLVQSQVLDQQTRRVLHDEVLPQVHTALLNLAAPGDAPGMPLHETIALLEKTHRQLSGLLRSAPSIGAGRIHQLGFMGALRQVIEVDLHGAFDEVTWEMQPEGEQKLAILPALVAEVLFYASREAVRNAARHGRQKGAGTRLCVTIGLQYQHGLLITVEDNGEGFAAGEEGLFSEARTDGESHGQGLALHSTMMAVIGGSLTAESAPGQYTRITLELPDTAYQNWE